MHPTSSEQLQIFLEIATEAALAAGAVLQGYFGKLDAIVEKGRPGDLVTEADKASEAAILNVLARHLPSHAILAEESGKLGNTASEYLWVIDPLDGTTNYAHEYPFFAVSIGLLIAGVPQVGVIFDPFHNELFRAAIGLGATCNRPSGDARRLATADARRLATATLSLSQSPTAGNPPAALSHRSIQVSQTAELSKSLLVTGFAYDRRETTDNNYTEFCHLTHLTQGVRRSGSAALDLAHVACGRVDGYWERGIAPWDIAAGVVLLEEAGGKVSAYDGSPLSIESGRILATNGHIHAALSQELLHVPSLSVWGNTTNIVSDRANA
jgi:myo-inositol-1(or 4)-monophosphatase